MAYGSPVFDAANLSTEVAGGRNTQQLGVPGNVDIHLDSNNGVTTVYNQIMPGDIG